MTRDHASTSGRPLFPRNDTEALLDYYQSPLANQGAFDDTKLVQTIPPKPPSPSSSSSSDYSSSDSEYSAPSPLSSPSTSRPLVSRPGANDKRRMAVVPNSEMSIALVVPPDGAYKHQRSQSHAVEDEGARRPELASNRRSTGQSVLTPDIGDNKSIDAPVAPPVVIGTFSLQSPESYLTYKPGIHSTAGPLPAPPSLDPQKREQIEAVRRALQLPPTVEAILAKRTPSPSHRREGAFAPTIVEAKPQHVPELSSPASIPVTIQSFTATDAVTATPSPATSVSPLSPVSVNVIIQPPPRNASLHETSPKKKRRVSAELSISEHSNDEFPPTPSPPPKSLRNSLQRGLRRMSLSRSPSLSSRTPSPPETSFHHPPRTQNHQPRPPVHKIKSLYPSAMYCHELHPLSGAPKLTPLDRCRIYTQKINELYVYDCGLSDWLVEAQIRTHPSPSINEGGPNVPSTKTFSPQPRNTSYGSEASEMTFPIRPDAGVATDLSSPASSTSNPSIVNLNPAAMPYPALPPRLTAMQKPGFFASLGRKASTSKKGVPIVTLPTSQSTPRAVLTKRPTVAPSVPGGPRPPGGWKRMSRSQTISAPRHGSESEIESSFSDAYIPRMSSPAQSYSASSPHDSKDPDFKRQLDKLAILLPQADRDVLAGYLRRSGQDLVAIGLYLDDEKNGRIRRD